MSGGNVLPQLPLFDPLVLVFMEERSMTPAHTDTQGAELQPDLAFANGCWNALKFSALFWGGVSALVVWWWL